MFDDFADQVLSELRRMLCLRGRSSITRGDAEVWESTLKRQNVTWGEFQAAVDHWIDTQQFFPSPADIVVGVTKVRVAMRATNEADEREEAKREWDRIELEDGHNPAFGPVLIDGEPDPDWLQDEGEPMWLRKLAHEHGLCSWVVAHDPARSAREVPVIGLYASSGRGKIPSESSATDGGVPLMHP